MHNTQFDFMTFSPNAPAMLKSPPPTDPTQTISDDQIADDWLDDKMIVRQCQFFSSVTLPPKKGYALGEYEEEFETFMNSNEISRAVLQRFRDNLEKMSSRIRERNGHGVPYPYCDPKEIWRSVCV